MPNYADIAIGQELPTLKRNMARIHLVQYAAGSGDFNPLHYDADFPQAKALGDNIVHGRMKYAALGECVSNWLNHTGHVVSIGCQYRGMDMRGANFTVGGKVIAKRETNGQKLVDLELWTVTDEGKVTTPGNATVALRS